VEGEIEVMDVNEGFGRRPGGGDFERDVGFWRSVGRGRGVKEGGVLLEPEEGREV
jgi:hypothetical protein